MKLSVKVQEQSCAASKVSNNLQVPPSLPVAYGDRRSCTWPGSRISDSSKWLSVHALTSSYSLPGSFHILLSGSQLLPANLACELQLMNLEQGRLDAPRHHLTEFA